MKNAEKTTNPFEWMEFAVKNDIKSPTMELGRKFSLSPIQAKTVWLSSPHFQEDHCRGRICGSKSRGGSEYGNKNWLRRRYDLSEEELEYVFRDIWDGPANKISQAFLSVISTEKIAQSQLTQRARQELVKLQSRYTSS